MTDQEIAALINDWIDQEIHPNGYLPENDDREVNRLAEACCARLTGAHPSLTKHDLDRAADGDLARYLRAASDRINDSEVRRLLARDP